MKQLNSYQLCYVEGGRWMDEDITLYFTEKDVKDQWGDGWSNIHTNIMLEHPMMKIPVLN